MTIIKAEVSKVETQKIFNRNKKLYLRNTKKLNAEICKSITDAKIVIDETMINELRKTRNKMRSSPQHRHSFP